MNPLELLFGLLQVWSSWPEQKPEHDPKTCKCCHRNRRKRDVRQPSKPILFNTPGYKP